MNHTTTRRIFIARGVAGSCALLAASRVAQAAPSRAEENDETALALGYKHDTARVDAKRFPNHSAAQKCSNCSFYQGGPSDDWAGCAMFGRKHIAGQGWCSAWAKKPG
jgi:hypothetical protein